MNGQGAGRSRVEELQTKTWRQERRVKASQSELNMTGAPRRNDTGAPAWFRFAYTHDRQRFIIPPSSVVPTSSRHAWLPSASNSRLSLCATVPIYLTGFSAAQECKRPRESRSYCLLTAKGVNWRKRSYTTFSVLCRFPSTPNQEYMGYQDTN